jgi:predicted metal-dependent hydrolase
MKRKLSASSQLSDSTPNTDVVTSIQLGEITVEVVRKDIKNVHLSVYPPTGRVRISAPRRMSLETIRLFAISKLGWIKQHQKKLRQQEREAPREYLDRESHFVWGKRYLLKIVEGAPRIELNSANKRALTISYTILTRRVGVSGAALATATAPSCLSCGCTYSCFLRKKLG